MTIMSKFISKTQHTGTDNKLNEIKNQETLRKSVSCSFRVKHIAFDSDHKQQDRNICFTGWSNIWWRDGHSDVFELNVLLTLH